MTVAHPPVPTRLSEQFAAQLRRADDKLVVMHIRQCVQCGAYGHGTGYGYAQRGAVSIHRSEWDKHDPKRTGVVIYLYVSDADAVRAEWASCGVEGRVGEIRNTDYGMREFGFVDMDGTLHRVGSKLP
jgi:hypothetical protein